MNIETIVSHLGKDIGLNLSFDEKACISLKFDNKHLLVIEAPEGNERIFIYSMIGITPQQQKLEAYERLLEANLFGKGTGPCWFSCNPKTGEIFLSSAIEKETLNYDRFLSTLESFLERLDYWSKRIEEPLHTTGAEDSIADGSPVSESANTPSAAQLYNPFV